MISTKSLYQWFVILSHSQLTSITLASSVSYKLVCRINWNNDVPAGVVAPPPSPPSWHNNLEGNYIWLLMLQCNSYHPTSNKRYVITPTCMCCGLRSLTDGEMKSTVYAYTDWLVASRNKELTVIESYKVFISVLPQKLPSQQFTLMYSCTCQWVWSWWVLSAMRSSQPPKLPVHNQTVPSS